MVRETYLERLRPWYDDCGTVKVLTGVRRYDVRGKKVMAMLDKYCATEVGLLGSKLVGRGPGVGDLVENAVHSHLAARGFDVDAGLTPSGEIDFAAVKGGRPR